MQKHDERGVAIANIVFANVIFAIILVLGSQNDIFHGDLGPYHISFHFLHKLRPMRRPQSIRRDVEDVTVGAAAA